MKLFQIDLIKKKKKETERARGPKWAGVSLRSWTPVAEYINNCLPPSAAKSLNIHFWSASNGRLVRPRVEKTEPLTRKCAAFYRLRPK